MAQTASESAVWLEREGCDRLQASIGLLLTSLGQAFDIPNPDRYTGGDLARNRPYAFIVGWSPPRTGAALRFVTFRQS